jgi:hypothetical protein
VPSRLPEIPWWFWWSPVVLSDPRGSETPSLFWLSLLYLMHYRGPAPLKTHFHIIRMYLQDPSRYGNMFWSWRTQNCLLPLCYAFYPHVQVALLHRWYLRCTCRESERPRHTLSPEVRLPFVQKTHSGISHDLGLVVFRCWCRPRKNPGVRNLLPNSPFLQWRHVSYRMIFQPQWSSQGDFPKNAYCVNLVHPWVLLSLDLENKNILGNVFMSWAWFYLSNI